jgi:hypothetical protein
MGRIDDGHPTTISFASTPSGETLLFWEKEVTPPGLSGGGPNNTTTMRNSVWRTAAPKKLITMTAGSFVASYDPEALDQVLAMLNVKCLITITFSDGATYAFWGWLDQFTPGASVEGEQPTATVTIEPANENSAAAETAPVLTPAA